MTDFEPYEMQFMLKYCSNQKILCKDQKNIKTKKITLC